MPGWKHAFGLSAEAVKTATPPGTVRLIEHSVHSEDGRYVDHVMCYPMPTEDPADPLNWADWRKISCISTVALYAFVANYISASMAPALPVWNLSFPRDRRPLEDLTQLVAFNVLVLGLGNILWVPFSNTFGRRFTIILSTMTLFIASCCGIFLLGFEATLAIRIVQGFGSSASETVVPAIVGDMFFVHERGKWMAFFTASLASGSVLGGITGGYIAAELGWVSQFWFATALAGLSFVLAIFLVPETIYDRDQPGLPIQQTLPHPSQYNPQIPQAQQVRRETVEIRSSIPRVRSLTPRLSDLILPSYRLSIPAHLRWPPPDTEAGMTWFHSDSELTTLAEDNNNNGETTQERLPPHMYFSRFTRARNQLASRRRSRTSRAPYNTLVRRSLITATPIAPDRARTNPSTTPRGAAPNSPTFPKTPSPPSPPPAPSTSGTLNRIPGVLCPSLPRRPPLQQQSPPPSQPPSQPHHPRGPHRRRSHPHPNPYHLPPSSRLTTTSTLSTATTIAYPPYTYLHSLSLPPPPSPLLPTYILKPWSTLRLPATWLIMLQYGGLVGGVAVISTVGPQILTHPPYNWGKHTGLLFIGALVGIVLGGVWTGVVADRRIQRAAQREESGYAEPEARVVVLVPALVVGTGGCWCLGFVRSLVVAGEGWIGLEVGFGMVAFALAQVPSVWFGYLLDAYGQLASDCFVMICILRAIIPFAWTFFIAQWVKKSGFLVPFGSFTAIMGVFALLTIPMLCWGKRMRIATARYAAENQ